MAFDGFTIAALTAELSEKLTGGRIAKIAQPEADELLLQIKSEAGLFRLLISASASLPLLTLTGENKPSPATAPAFCMLLRKHIAGGRIVSISQPGLERVVEFGIEHFNEMGDLCQKRLIVELMGKHSNIIFCEKNGRILDAIKHISGLVSSVREVLPGRDYFLVQTQDKTELKDLWKSGDRKAFEEGVWEALSAKAGPLSKTIYKVFTGVSPILAQELSYRAGIDSDLPAEALSTDGKSKLLQTFCELMEALDAKRFFPCIVYDRQDRQPLEFGVFSYRIYEKDEIRSCGSVSEVLIAYYGEKARYTRIRQKSADLRHITMTALERQNKKYSLQAAQLKDTEKKEDYRIRGELLHTWGYQAEEGAKSLTCENYYTGEQITIPLDPDKSAMENAKACFDRYTKLKRTYESLSVLIEETKQAREHLESVLTSLDLAQNEEDLAQIRSELAAAGYIRERAGQKKKAVKGVPLHFISSDGFDLYVGKNNFQNEEITFKLAKGNDWWFHAKKRPGSHVILKTDGGEVPDRAFEEAGKLAAHFSKSDGASKIEVDYIEKKHVKKPAGAAPGFVVYYTNYSMLIDGDISQLKQVKD